MLFILLIGCESSTPTVVEKAQAMGGPVAVTLRCPPDQVPQCHRAARAAITEIQRVDALATDWSPSGEIAQLNLHAGQGPQPVSAEVAEMLERSLELAQVTDGAFDPTINALWGLWDFNNGVVADPALLRERLPLVDWHELHVEGHTATLDQPGMSVTVGGIAQGWAAEHALAMIPSQWEAMVDVSGDIALRGTWRVGVQHPRGPHGTLIAALTVKDAVVVSSGDYERFFIQDGVRYHHILDPSTGQPARAAWATTTVASTGAAADGLSTALMITGPKAAPVDALNAWALVIQPDSSIIELGQPGTAVSDLEIMTP